MNAYLLGYGYWGPVLARSIAASSRFKLAGVVDVSRENLSRAKKAYPSIETYENVELLPDSDAHAAAFVATPPITHEAIAISVLNKGYHVWLEKPATTSLESTDRIIALASEKNLKIVVDHPYLYAPAVNYVRQRILNQSTGDLYYIESSRCNLGIFSPDVSVLWDLVVHDISIALYLNAKKRVEKVSCLKVNPLNSPTDSMVYLNLFFEDSIHASFSANWLSPVKVRRMVFGFEKESIVYDDTDSNEKLRIYSQDFSPESPKILNKSDLLVNYRTGDLLVPKIETMEPILLAVEDFGNFIVDGGACRNDLARQRETTRILEAADRSSKLGGSLVGVS